MNFFRKLLVNIIGKEVIDLEKSICSYLLISLIDFKRV